MLEIKRYDTFVKTYDASHYSNADFREVDYALLKMRQDLKRDFKLSADEAFLVLIERAEEDSKLRAMLDIYMLGYKK
jgi:hypothetical protein